ncbi:hypothetical protein FOZ61_008404 [Perkinsus olseni]|uniref:Uncharacterized protein n=1 Tax=Perkinsus olseni TaxID=32597 RepID=A0A7J6L4U8_PEROL|nr:hypothetical protein FOZ61_008404 [Perkinsus olseni]
MNPPSLTFPRVTCLGAEEPPLLPPQILYAGKIYSQDGSDRRQGGGDRRRVWNEATLRRLVATRHQLEQQRDRIERKCSAERSRSQLRKASRKYVSWLAMDQETDLLEEDEPSSPNKYDIQNSEFFQFKQFLGRCRPTEIPAEFFEINTAFYSYACRICQPSATSSLSNTLLTSRRASTLASLQPPSHAPAPPSPPLTVNDRPVADAAVISATQATTGNDRL